MATAEQNVPPQEGSGLPKRLLKSTWTYVVVGALAIATTIGSGAWSALKPYFESLGAKSIGGVDSALENYVASVVVDQLKDEKSPLYSSLDQAIDKMRRSEAGAVSAGSFTLTPTNRSYELFLYFPLKEYTAKLYYKVMTKGYCGQVLMAFPTSPNYALTSPSDAIDLERLLDKGSPEAAEISNIIFASDKDTKSLIENLHVITFQLQESAACSLPSLQIDYAALVAPSIRMEP